MGEKLPGMLFGFGFLGSVGALLIYLLFSKFISHLKPNKKVIIVFFGLSVLFGVLAVISGVVNVSNNKTSGEQRVANDLISNSGKTKFTTFPVRIEDFEKPPKMYGLWPYGVKGNNSNSHNEGHLGWDFELKKGSKLYAIADLRIAQIHDGDNPADGKPLKVIEAYAKLNNQDIHIVYHSVNNLEDYVVEEAIIREGSVLAEVGYPLSDESAMIHFGIFGPKDSVGSCPSDFFTDSLKSTIDKIVANSIDMKTGKPYASACVGKINKDLYYQNYPDSVKYLQGGEQWE